MQRTIGITRLGVRVRDLQATSQTTEIVYADKVPSDIRYARKRGKKPWRIVVFRDPDDAIIQLVERQKRGEG